MDSDQKIGKRPSKQVSFRNETTLCQVKYFKISDTPNTPGMVEEELKKYWVEIDSSSTNKSNLGVHSDLHGQQLKNYEMKLERENLETRKIHNVKSKLASMKPTIKHLKLIKVNKGSEYKKADAMKSKEKQI